MDSKTFNVKAVDKAGFTGSSDTEVVTDPIGACAASSVVASAVEDGIEVAWTNISATPVKEYKVTVGSTYATSTELGRVTVSPFILRWPFSTKLPSGPNQIWIVGVDTVGNESATSYVNFSINVPSTPVISTEWKSDVLRLSWASCKSTFEIDYYEVTHYITAEGAETAKTDKIKGLFIQYPLDWMDSKTFNVKAVDKAGFTGSSDTEVVTDPIGAYAASSVVASAVEDGIQVTWTNISATPVKEYKVTVGSAYATSTEIGRVAVSPFVLKWPCSTKVVSGSNCFWVVGVDIVGNESITAYDDFTISLPTTPSVTAERSKDIVRFTWANCKTTFDIDHYRIEATLDAVTTTDKVIGLYAEYKLDWVGTKTFRFYAVDKAGFESSSYDSESVTVSAVGAPTALTTSGGVYEVAVSVTFPTNEYFAGCEIWAGTANDRTLAKKIAEVSSAENPATVVKKLKAELADSWYFWAKSKDIYGNYSTWYPSGSTSGVLGAPSTTPSDYVDALSGAIDYDDFVASLQAGLGTDVGGTWTYYTGEGYSLYINESGNITGWRNFTDIDAPTVSTFDIWANKFRIINYDDETQLPVVPFVVGTVNGSSMVGINGDLIVDGTILGRHIKATETITLNSGGTLSIGNAGSIEIGVGGSITILGGMTGYAQISDKPNSLSDINSTEGTKLTGIADGATVGADWSTNLDNRPNELTDGRIIAGFDSNGNVIRNISGPLLPTTSPTDEGLYINQEHLGYWSGTDWNSYIDRYGNFQFLGDELNYITWNSLDGVLDIRGTLVADDIVSGTLTCANVTISLAGGIEVTGGQGILVDDGADITLDNTDNLDPAKLIFREFNGHASFEIYSYAYIATFEHSVLLINGTGPNTHRDFAIHNFEYIELGDDSGMSQLTIGGSTQDHAYLKGLYYVDIESFDGGAAATSGVRAKDDTIIAWGTSTGAIFTAAVRKTIYSGGIVDETRFSVKADGTIGVYNDIIPNEYGLYDLGSVTYAFNVLYAQALHNPHGTFTIACDIEPTDAYDLGSTTNKFEQGYINKVYAERVEQSNADAFQVKLFADQQNFAVGSNVTVQFDSKTNDHTFAFNRSTHTYTAQGDGWRQFNLKLWIYGFDSAATQLIAYIVTSNETFEFAIHPATIMDADGNFQISGSILAYMDNGDTAFVRIYQNGGTQQGSISSAYSYFSAYYVNN
jgi:hypothetical protein